MPLLRRREFCSCVLAGAGALLARDIHGAPHPPAGPEFDVTRFGALGTGRGDDSPAFAAALHAAAASGGVVRVPRGRYALGATLHLESAVSIVGAGPSSVLLWHANPRYGIAATAVHDVAVRSLALVGPVSFGVLFDRVADGELADCELSQGVLPLPGAGYCGGVLLLGAERARVLRNRFFGNGETAHAHGADILCNGQTNGRSMDLIVSGNSCMSERVAYHICCFDTAKARITGNRVSGAKTSAANNDGYGIVVYETSGNPRSCHDNAVTGNSINRTEGTGIYLVKGSNSSVEHNEIHDVATRQADGTLPVGGIALNDTTGVRVADNVVRGSARAGVVVSAWKVPASGASVLRNTVTECRGPGIELRGTVSRVLVDANLVAGANGGIASRFDDHQSGLTITGNRIERTTGTTPAISLQRAANVRVLRNRISDFGGFAIDVTVVGADFRVDSNTVTGQRVPRADSASTIRVRPG